MVRPKVPILDPDAVVRVALQLIDTGGLASLSLRHLADQFGVSMSALYHHFENKDQILQLVARQIVLEIPRPDARNMDWAELMVQTSLAFRRVMLRHQGAIALLLRFSPRAMMPQLYDGYEALLRERGVPEEMVEAVISSFEILTLGSVAIHSSRLNETGGGVRIPAKVLRVAEQDFEDQVRTFAEGMQVRLSRMAARNGQDRRATG